MKILYASGLSPNDSSLYRLWALERLGHQVIPFNAYEYESRNPLLRKIIFRLSAGPAVNRLNRDLLNLAEREKPDRLLDGLWRSCSRSNSSQRIIAARQAIWT